MAGNVLKGASRPLPTWVSWRFGFRLFWCLPGAAGALLGRLLLG